MCYSESGKLRWKEVKSIKRKSSSLLLLVWLRFSLLIFLLLFHLWNLLCAFDEMRKLSRSFIDERSWMLECFRKSLQLKLIEDKHKLFIVRVKVYFVFASRRITKPIPGHVCCEKVLNFHLTISSKGWKTVSSVTMLLCWRR